MLLFQKRFHEGLTSGQITVTFRRWTRPQVKPGGRYRCHPIGVLEVDKIDRVRVKDLTHKDARQSGFTNREALLEYIASGPKGDVEPTTELFRVELHYGGDGDRVDIALDTDLTPEDIETITQKLARMDKNGAWTMDTLRLIEAQPKIAASKLAPQLGRETAPFKVDVRKLKRLGLTQSFEVGYDIAPRGRAYLDALPKKKRKRPSKKKQ